MQPVAVLGHGQGYDVENPPEALPQEDGDRSIPFPVVNVVKVNPTQDG